MGVISGIGGLVDGKTHVRNWSVNSSADLQRIVASNTKGGSTHLAGNKDWTGQYQAFGHTPATLPGDSFTFEGAIDLVNGASGSAMCNQVEIVWDIESGAPIGHTVSFEANGPLTLGAATVTADASVPNAPSSIGTKVQVADVSATPAFSELTDVRTITLTLTRDNQSYVSSGTAGQAQRKIGNLNFALSISLYTDNFGAAIIPTVNEVQQVRLFVNSTEYWDLRWARFGEASDIAVDRETAAIVGMTLNANMEGFTLIGSTPTEGFIKTPALTTYWP